MVVVHETAPCQQLSQLISVDFGECAGMKILEQVIDAMIEGSDRKALKKALVGLFLRTILTWRASPAAASAQARRRYEAQDDGGRDNRQSQSQSWSLTQMSLWSALQRFDW